MKRLLCLLLGIHTVTAALQAGDLTNTVFVMTNLTFSLRSRTNFRAASQFKADEPILFRVAVTGTNEVLCRRFPYRNQTFDFHLFDERGRELPKTAAALANNKLPRPPRTSHEVDPFQPHAIGDDSYNLFRAHEMFVITNKGNYEMEIRYRFLVNMTNGVPDYEAIGDAFKFVKNSKFGIVTSPPVRVRIIKE